MMLLHPVVKAKERPLPFSEPMVLAEQAGIKTQTRRLNGLEKFQHAHGFELYDGTWYAYGDAPTNYGGEVQMNDWREPVRCPYGKPGDRLWVREAWRALETWDGYPPRLISPSSVLWYEADGPLIEPHAWGKLRPPMFMPRWACRTELEITAVRVERLQAINEDDARAEGVDEWGRGALSPAEQAADPSDKFRWLWDSINEARCPWSSNPWVWAVSFRRIEP